jgi:CheY-like chemotaxis protein
MSSLQGKTVIVADDSPSIRKLVETILKANGCTVLRAADGRMALQLAFDNDVDAIVADHEMPHLSGGDLFKILSTDPEKKKIPRIMISGLTSDKDKPVSEFANVFVAKTANLKQELVAALEKLL